MQPVPSHVKASMGIAVWGNCTHNKPAHHKRGAGPEEGCEGVHEGGALQGPNLPVLGDTKIAEHNSTD